MAPGEFWIRCMMLIATFLNLLAHCHFQSHLFCSYSQIVCSALLVIIFWTNRCDRFFSLLKYLPNLPRMYRIKYSSIMIVDHGILHAFKHSTVHMCFVYSFQEYPCVEKRNDIRPSASLLNNAFHDVMIFIECRETRRSEEWNSECPTLPIDSVNLIGMHVIDEYTEVLVFKYKAYIIQNIVIPTIISLEYTVYSYSI